MTWKTAREEQNRKQEGYSTMNSGSLPQTGPSDVPAQPQQWRQIEAWRQLLAECGLKASRGRVHGLRVATLRLQAELEYWVGARKPDIEAARVAKRWNKQAEKLRRALRLVRGADVYLAKLASLRVSLAGPGDYQPRCSRHCVSQIVDFESKLRRVRRSAAKKLMAAIEERRERLDRLSKEMEAALAPQMQMAADRAEGAVAGLIAGLDAEFPELNGDSLHLFRKRIKKVRYLADLCAAADSQAARQAAMLRKMQVAAGEWHDWDTLARKAERRLSGRNQGDDLVELLGTLAAEALQKALSLCRNYKALLLKHGAGQEAPRQAVVQKLPVQRAEPVAATENENTDCA